MPEVRKTRRGGAPPLGMQEADPEAAARFNANATPPEAPAPRAPGEPEEPKWPVLDEKQIEICKQIAHTNEPGGLPIYKYESCGKTFVFRPLQGHEWKTYLAKWRAEGDASTASTQDEDICRRSVIWPNNLNWNALEAGHPAALAVLTRQQSGFPIITESGKVTGETLKVSLVGEAPKPEPLPLPDEETLAAIRASTSTKRILRADYPDGSYYLISPLSRERWTELQARITEDKTLDIAAEVCQEGIVWPKNPDLASPLAGYIDQVSDLIMDQSGFGVNPIVTEL